MRFWSIIAPLHQVEPPGEPPPPTGRLTVGLLGIAFAAFLASLDQRLTAASLADMIGNFDYGRDEGSWIATAYSAGDIAIVPMTPWLATALSLRRVVAFEVALFALASAAVPLSRDYFWVIGCRFLQGLGEGGLIPLMLLGILQHVPPHRRTAALGIYALSVTAAPLLADTVAGVMTDLYTWQALFYVSPALGPVALFLVLLGLPEEKPNWAAFREADYFGVFCLVLACVCIAVALGQGQRLDWFDSGIIDALFLLAAFLIVAFLLNEGFRRTPLYELSLLRRRNFVIGLGLIVLFSTAILGVTQLMVDEQTRVRMLRELQVGNITLWLLLPQLVSAPLAVWLLRRLDARLVLATGLGLVAFGAWMCVWITPVWDGNDFQPFLQIQAAGWPLVLIPTSFTTVGVLPKKDRLTGGAIFNVFRALGGTLGAAFLGAVVTVRERVHSNNDINAYLDPGRQPVLEALRRYPPAALHREQSLQSLVMAVADAYGWLAIVVLCGLLLVLMQAPTPVPVPASQAARRLLRQAAAE